ncbi:dynein axonemal assembly factor 1 homolog [Drosophila ficusphila]|uniref:dynein axonemal assembly factor 1 homolog n=1 Tax=Drosophila ficusphila TaxID=30025 RepID=UPI001C8A5453|nr:dynein axonemal assembly factor 1 homolog [Drosophila ficusphila]
MSQGTATVAPRKEITGLNRMTPKGLKELCKKNKLYQTPRLNDVLYLHYQGYQCIECLEEYTELKCLWLECNAISEIQGLEQLTKLKCLFLQNNLVTKIENLEPCRELDTLNLSSNHIRKIQNIGSDILPVLNTLNISSNYLKDSESLSDLVHCKTLSVLDLANNRIDDILVVKVFEQMPSLRVLVLQGNPVVSRLPQYRKTLILACKELTYLDSRPVFPRDRACAEAWKREGYEGERKENNRWNRAERRKTRESVNCTIRMRNRHHPPDEQYPLLRSSDSEDDACAERSRKRAELENGGVDDLWDEVSGEQPSSDHGSSSSSSAEGNESVGSQHDHIAEKLSNRNGRYLEGRPKVLYESDLGNEESVEKEPPKISSETIEAIGGEAINQNESGREEDKEVRVPITVAKLEVINIRSEKGDNDDASVSGKDSNVTSPSESDEQREEAELTVNTFEQVVDVEVDNMESQKKLSSRPSDSCSDLDSTEDLESTCQALNIVAQNDELGEDPNIKEIKSKLVADMYESFGADSYDELDEPLELLLDEDTQNVYPEDRLFCEEKKTPRDLYQDFEEPCFTPKTKEQEEFEQERAMANEKCAHDLEEMGSQMEEDLEELKQCTKHLVESVKDETDQTDTETDEEELTAHQNTGSPLLAQQFAERRRQMKLREEEKALKDSNMKASKDNDENDEQDHLFAKILDDSTDNVPKRVFGSGSDATSQTWTHEECLRQLPLSGKNEILIQDDIFSQPITESTSAQEAEEICSRMEKKLAADEENLRKLLQELEDEADEKFDIETQVEFEEDITIGATDVASICTSLLGDIIDELTFNEILLAQKPKSFEFGPIESDEEFSYSVEPQLSKLVPPELEDPGRGKSLRECLDTFSDFVTSMADPKLPLMLGRNSSSAVDKIRAAQELLKSKHLAEFNNETAESLDAQIAKENEKRKRRVAASAARCFGQREKYDDTLEVVDNRLMVVKKDTGELEELPPPPALISDTESDEYDTAEEDYSSGRQGNGQEMRRPWTTPYKPKPRKSEEYLVTEAMQRCQMESVLQDSPDESKEDDVENDAVEDEFYSLEAMTTFSSLDSEFFQKLDLQKVTNSEEAESAIQCMRSYNELKSCMRAGSSEHQLTTEEKEMLQEMLSQSQSNSPKLEEEDDLLKKMVERMKEVEERERQLREEPQVDPKEMDSIKLSLGGTKLFEYKSQISEAEIENSEMETENLKLEGKGENEDETKAEKEVSSQDKESIDPFVKSTRSSPRKNIDDDNQSDVSTDYESGEEIMVIEPPKLPEAVLKTFFSDGLETDRKLVHDLEEATRRNLYCPLSKISPKSDENLCQIDNPSPDIQLQETEKEKKSPPESASSGPSVSAKAKWAKIAQRLHEFLDPETIAMLDKQEFAESDEDEESEEGTSGYDLEITEDTEKIQAENPKKQVTSEEHITDESISDGLSWLAKSHSHIEETGTTLMFSGEENKASPTQDLVGENPTEIKDRSTNKETDEASLDDNEKTPISTNSPIITNNEADTNNRITMDYFEAQEPSEADGLADTKIFKTEQIECNLEILSEDGDVVVKEVSVSAQVTYK